MIKSKQQLLIDQIDQKMAIFKPLKEVIIPQTGWVNTFRTTLKMSLRQLGLRLNITSQSVKEIEQREVNQTITLKTLSEVANALDMRLVYGFVSKHASLEEMIEKRAQELATEIVLRTHTTMSLEDQQNSNERIKKAIEQKAAELQYEMPRYLWD